MSFYKVSIDINLLVGVEARGEVQAIEEASNITKEQVIEYLKVDGDLVIGEYVDLIEKDDEDDIIDMGNY